MSSGTNGASDLPVFKTAPDRNAPHSGRSDRYLAFPKADAIWNVPTIGSFDRSEPETADLNLAQPVDKTRSLQ